MCSDRLLRRCEIQSQSYHDIGALQRQQRSMKGKLKGTFTKVCVLGDVGVGKTSLALRFVSDTFYEIYRPTFNVNHFEKRIVTEYVDYNMLIWDTAGTERFKALTSNYVRGAAAVLLVFDVANRASFESVVSYWLPNLEKWQPGIPAVLVGNKTDAFEDFDWAINMRTILTFCAQHKLRFYETSAKTGKNIDACFKDVGTVSLRSIADEVPYESDEQEDFSDSFQLTGRSPYHIKRGKNNDKGKKKKIFDCSCSLM